MPMVPEALVAHAGLRAHRRGAFGGVRRLCAEGARHPHRRRQAEGDPVRELRHRGGRVVAYKPLLDAAIDLAKHKPEACLILQRPQSPSELTPGRDHDWAETWDDALVWAKNVLEPVPLLATDPLYILYTSGTTGIPKGVVRDNGGHMVALKWSMKNLYGIEPGESWWAASDIGWVVGHSYIVYAPLLHGCTTILYEGKPVGTPDAGAFWRVIAEHNASAMFTAPTAFRAIKKEDPEGKLFAKYDLSKFRTLFLAGERADPDTIQWAERLLKKPVIDHWWQTETGWAIAGNPVGLGQLPVKHGSPTVAMPGYDIRASTMAATRSRAARWARSSSSCRCRRHACRRCGRPTTACVESYLAEFPGYYKTADAGYIDKDGYVFVMGRTDDIINVAGHRLSTGGMEEVLSAHQDVAECAVLGIKDELKGEVPCGFIVLKAGRQPAAGRHRERVRAACPRQGRPGGVVPPCHRRRAAAEDAVGQNPARHHQEDR